MPLRVIERPFVDWPDFDYEGYGIVIASDEPEWLMDLQRSMVEAMSKFGKGVNVEESLQLGLGR